MTLRLKLTAVLIALSATATLSVGAWSYRTTAERLDAEIDRSLDAARRAVPAGQRLLDDRRPQPPLRADPDLLAGGQLVVQVLDGDGAVVRTAGPVVLPVDADERRLATAGAGGEVRREVTVDGVAYRLVTSSPDRRVGAVQVARSLEERDRLLAALRRRTLAAVVLVTGAAAAGGWALTRQATARLGRLTDAAEQVATSGDLTVPVPAAGPDETGRLAGAFGHMLTALATSRHAQEQLVADAGHELRTPLTSLRANLAVLRRHPDLGPEPRRALIADLEAEARELSTLVDELVQLATDGSTTAPAQPIALGPLVEQLAAQARRRTGREVHVTTDGSSVVGYRTLVERAVANLLANAAKFDPDGDAPIQITVRERHIEVCDRGPGIDEQDLPRVFERFYRAPGARSAPGSGLGLAIVADTAARHGGRVWARNRPGGGACVGFTVGDVAEVSDSHRTLTDPRR
jgi:two-component system, OmpR family, sensor histidine kinase MprB